MKLTENRTPTTKNVTPIIENVIKYINGVNDFITVCCKKKVEKAKPYPGVTDFITVRCKKNVEKAKPYPDLTAVRVQDSKSSDADSILNVSDSNVRLLNGRKQSRNNDPRVAELIPSVVQPNEIANE